MTPSGANDVVNLERVRERFLAALLAGARREAVQVLMDAIDRGAAILDVQMQVIQAAQREIGRRWQENTVSIAQEHMATAISQAALAHVYDYAPRAPANGKRVVVACVEGELHDFPARMVADALDLVGFDVCYLGANVPTDSLLAMMNADRPDLLALSVTMAFNAPALRTAVARLRAEGPPGLRIAVGGGACEWISSMATDVQADVTGSDAAEFVSAAQQLLGTSA